jgi:hypothetical protein
MAMKQILGGCDGSSSNPMNWKFDGSNVLGSYGYIIIPKRANRPFPLRVRAGTGLSWVRMISTVQA